MENDKINLCPVCHQGVKPEYYFCPNCGNNLKEKLMPVSGIVQIGLYALAIFLPPLGLWPGIKYLMKKSPHANPHAKRVGIITIVLTLISSVLTIWATFALLNNYLNQINSLMY
jgi:hypothetical protein